MVIVGVMSVDAMLMLLQCKRVVENRRKQTHTQTHTSGTGLIVFDESEERESEGEREEEVGDGDGGLWVSAEDGALTRSFSESEDKEVEYGDVR